MVGFSHTRSWYLPTMSPRALQEGCMWNSPAAPAEGSVLLLAALCHLHNWTEKPETPSSLLLCSGSTHCSYFLLLTHPLERSLRRADILLHFVVIQQPSPLLLSSVTISKDLRGCQPNVSDTQTKWNSSEWSWQPGNFRNKLIWQGVFIMLQGTGWSDKNRSWQIGYLLENGTPRWCIEMRGGVWSGSRRWGWLAWWKPGDRALFVTEVLSFGCAIKHGAGSQLSAVAPVTVRRICQCTSALAFCDSFCFCSTPSWCLLLTSPLSPGPLLPSWTCPGRSPGGDFAQIAQLC